MLLDLETLALVQAIEPVLGEAGSSTGLKPELLQCQVEITTRPCRTTGEVLEELVALRGELHRDAALAGVRIAACGTHPYSPMQEQLITARDRYRELVAALRFPARRVVCFGMHVHVSVGGAVKGLELIEALLPDLPLLLALAASSPFLEGEETGLASTRLILGQAMPRTGLPPAFESYEDYASSLSRLRRAGAVPDSTHLWWDVRLHPAFGTIEVRIMDVQPSVEDSAALAGLIQALVRHYGRLYDRGAGFPRANRLVVAENRWLAARHGVRAPLVADDDEVAPARALAERLLERIEDDAAAVGAGQALERIADLTQRGSSAERQLRDHRHGKSLEEILAGVVGETWAS
jgi:carboxylate-amine ligase